MAVDRRKLSGWTTTVLGALLVLVGWVCFVLLAARPEVRFIGDWTPDHTATLSAQTKALVAELERSDARVEIATFFETARLDPNASRQQRAAVSVFNEIKGLTVDLLRQYNALGGDRLQVLHIDPKYDLDRAAAWRERVGPVRGNHVIVVAVFRPKKEGGESVRSKELLVTSELATIDFGNPGPMPTKGQRLPKLDKFLGEEAISSTIKTLLGSGIPVVYLLDGHRGKMATGSTDPYDYTNLVSALQEEGFKVNALNLGKDPVPDNATVLASLEPEVEFTAAECEKLLAYLRGGGRLFLNLAHKEHTRFNPQLEGLLEPLGVELSSQELMVLQFWREAKRAPTLEITRMNRSHRITKALFDARRPVVMQEAREIYKRDPQPEGVSVDLSLLKTTDQTWLARRSVETGLDLRPPGSGEEDRWASRSVGALIRVEPRQGVEHSGKVVLLTGATVRNIMTKQGSNLDFALNCFEWLAERPVAIPIRTSRLQRSAIDLGTNADERAARLSRTMQVQVLYTPLFFVLLGLFVAWRRRRI